MKLLALGALAAAALALPGGGVSGGAPGVTSTEILIGGTVPLSGSASAFGTVGPGANAYFKYVNAHGGVFGRKIRYLWRDDGYDPSRTIDMTRELVQQDKVFAIFNTVGTEHNVAIRGYLNAIKVPQIFGGTGASVIARSHKSYPWTMGYLPSFEGEGAIYGRYVVKHRPKARIAVLYEDSDYGKDLLRGLQRGLGKRASRIVAKQSYEVTDTDVNSQIAKLRRSKADTFMLFALPYQAIQSFVYAYKLKWRPQFFVSAVSIEPSIMAVARQGTNGKETNNALSVAFVKDPTSPAWRKDRAVALYRSIIALLPGRAGLRRLQLVRDDGRVFVRGRAQARRPQPHQGEPAACDDPHGRAQQPVSAAGCRRKDEPEQLLPDRQGAHGGLPEEPVGVVRPAGKCPLRRC